MVKSESKLKKSKKIGILGGAFDPIHMGHLLLAEYALGEFELDRVVFLPYNISVSKEPPQASSQDRLNMLKLATMDNPSLSVSDIEIKRGGISFSYETLRTFKKEEPKDETSFLIGSDAFSELKSWKNYKSLIGMTRFIVAVRPGTKVKSIKGAKYDRLLIPQIAISSSSLRNRAESGFSLRYLVPDKVRDYIVNFRLYR
ncbi:MAG: nicotinate-nucleotide adenylyltransferase [Candidatus Kaelpia imicola]|nr:nicotinate-nucleotide adenylyltransferase [Candidatus Kaelpia imicola]